MDIYQFTSNRSPRDHCIDNQKRERKPSSYCLRTRGSMVNYPRIIGEEPMRMMNTSVMVSRLDLVVLELAPLELCFVVSPRVSRIFGYL